MKINFEKGLESKEEAKKVVKQIKDVIENLTVAANLSKDVAVAANKTADEFRQALEVSTKTNIDLADALKSIHLKLNQYQEIIDKSEELAEIRKELAKFVLGSGMIKLGVLSNDKSE